MFLRGPTILPSHKPNKTDPKYVDYRDEKRLASQLWQGRSALITRRGMSRIILGAILCLLVISSVAVAGIMAYLSDTKEMENTYTIGNVRIEHNYYAYEGDSTTIAPAVKNIGENPCYIKAELAISNVMLVPFFHFQGTGENWTPIVFDERGIATIYYTVPLRKGEQTSTIYIDSSDTLATEYNGVTLTDIENQQGGDLNCHIIIKATAIQTRYNGSEATTAMDAFEEFEKIYAPLPQRETE